MNSALVSPKAKIGHDVSIGYGTRVMDNVIIEERCTIGDHCVIGHKAQGSWPDKTLRIGSDAVIRSHSIIYEGSDMGPALETGHHVLIREGTIAGQNLRVGSFSDIEGDCRIGDFCRFHSYVHVGRGSMIGSFVRLYSLTTLTNDPLPPSSVRAPVSIEDGTVVCVGAIVMPRTRLGKGCYVSAGSIVKGTIPSGAVVGREGQIVSHVTLLFDLDGGVRNPWVSKPYGYPLEALERLKKLRVEVLASRRNFPQSLAQA